MTIQPLFAYGTLQDADILGAVLGRVVFEAGFVAARLPDCAVLFYPGRVYPALVPRPGASAPGCLIPGLTALDLAALDAFEGEEYRRESRLVETAAGRRAASIYLPVRPIPDNAPPWSLSLWRARHKPVILVAEMGLARAARAAAAAAEKADPS